MTTVKVKPLAPRRPTPGAPKGPQKGWEYHDQIRQEYEALIDSGALSKGRSAQQVLGPVLGRLHDPRRKLPRHQQRITQDLLDRYRKTEFGDGDTTPSVSAPTSVPQTYIFNNSATTTITAFDDVKEGQVFYTILDGNTVIEETTYIKVRDSIYAQRRAIQTLTTAYTIVIGDSVLMVDTSGGDVTITLPPASDAYASESGGDRAHVFDVVKTSSDGNSLIVACDGSDTIDGSASASTTTQWDGIRAQAVSTTEWVDLR